MKTFKMIFLLFTAMGSFSCATIRPLDEGVIAGVGGESQLSKFQYYISKDVVLEATESSKQSNLEKGEAKIVTYHTEDKVYLNRATPGVVLSYHNVGNGRVLNVAFEEGDKTLQFARFGNNKYFYIGAAYEKSGQVVYDNKVYSYHSPSGTNASNKLLPKKWRKNYGETPCLLIKLSKKNIVEKSKHTMKGRKL